MSDLLSRFIIIGVEKISVGTREPLDGQRGEGGGEERWGRGGSEQKRTFNNWARGLSESLLGISACSVWDNNRGTFLHCDVVNERDVVNLDVFQRPLVEELKFWLVHLGGDLRIYFFETQRRTCWQTLETEQGVVFVCSGALQEQVRKMQRVVSLTLRKKDSTFSPFPEPVIVDSRYTLAVE